MWGAPPVNSVGSGQCVRGAVGVFAESAGGSAFVRRISWSYAIVLYAVGVRQLCVFTRSWLNGVFRGGDLRR